jgi:hypothetical protein
MVKVVQDVAQRWPARHDGACFFCGHSLIIPSASMTPTEAVQQVFRTDVHNAACAWVKARTLTREPGK